MSGLNPHVVLDGTVPEIHRHAVRFDGTQIVKAEAHTPSGSQATTPLEDNMSGTNSAPAAVVTAAALTVDQITKIGEIARAEAKSILAAENNEVRLATLIGDLKTSEATSKAEASSATAALAIANTKLADASVSLDKAMKDLDAAKANVTTLTGEKTELSKANETLKADLARVSKELADGKAVATITARTAELKAANLGTDARIAKATARNEDGSFKLSDTDFTDYVADLKSVAPPATPAAASTVAPGTTPPAATEEKGAAAPAASTEQATASAVPLQPDLGGELREQSLAIAALMGGGSTKLTKSGVDEMTALFGSDLTPPSKK